MDTENNEILLEELDEKLFKLDDLVESDKTKEKDETKNTYAVTVSVNDGTNTATQDITVSVTNINEAPVFPHETVSFETIYWEFNAEENQTSIGSVAAFDPEGDSLTYSFTYFMGYSGPQLVVDSSGVMTFLSAPDRETDGSDIYGEISVTDGVSTDTQEFLINILDVNDNVPVFESIPTSAAENQTAIGCVLLRDLDVPTPAPTPAPNCSIPSGLTLSVTGDNLQLSGTYLSFISAPDYETKSSYTATITASDGDNEVTQDITVNIANIREGVISYNYNITDGSDSAAPRLQATLIFDELLDVDDVIFSLRSNAGDGSNPTGFATFSASNTELNTWTLDQPLSENANGSYEYYLNFLFKSGANSSDFSGFSDGQNDRSKWSNLISAYAAQDLGFLNQSSPVVTFNNSRADTVATGFSGNYISPTDPSQYVTNINDAYLITGNDGDLATPITLTLKAVFNDSILYATERTRFYLDGESSPYYRYNQAEIQIDGDVVTYVWTLDSKTPIIRIQHYLYAYDAGLNKTSIPRTNYALTNSIGDTSVPTLSSISIGSRIGDSKEKYIDYDILLDSNDEGSANLHELYISLRGPNCQAIYTSLHDYSSDAGLLATQFKGSWRILDNNPNGIYRLSSNLYITDQQLNTKRYNQSTLKDSYSLGTTFTINDTVNDTVPLATPTILCPQFTTGNSVVRLSENYNGVALSYKDTIEDGAGNIVTPRFGLSGDDSALFSISSSGEVTFNNIPDYENPLDADGDNDYELVAHIYSLDSADSSYVSDNNHKIDDSFIIRVENLNDNSPVFTSEATFSAAENQTAIGSVTATDADGNSLTYSISGSEINISSSGVLTFITAPGYETKSSYTATVTVTDMASPAQDELNQINSTTQNITINIIDVDE